MASNSVIGSAKSTPMKMPLTMRKNRTPPTRDHQHELMIDQSTQLRRLSQMPQPTGAEGIGSSRQRLLRQSALSRNCEGPRQTNAALLSCHAVSPDLSRTR